MIGIQVSFTKSSIVKIVTIASTIGFLSGCAPMVSGTMNANLTEGDVKTKTADYFGVTQSKLTISDLKKNMLDTTYKTKVNGKLYNCTVYYGAVDCKVPGG